MKCIEKSMENIITSVRVDRVKEFSSGESMKFLFVHLLHWDTTGRSVSCGGKKRREKTLGTSTISNLEIHPHGTSTLRSKLGGHSSGTRLPSSFCILGSHSRVRSLSRVRILQSGACCNQLAYGVSRCSLRLRWCDLSDRKWAKQSWEPYLFKFSNDCSSWTGKLSSSPAAVLMLECRSLNF